MSQRQVLQGRPGRRPGSGPGPRPAGWPLTRCPGAASRSFRAVPARQDAVRAGGGRARRPAAEHRDPPKRRYEPAAFPPRQGRRGRAVRGLGDFRAPPLRLTPGSAVSLPFRLGAEFPRDYFPGRTRAGPPAPRCEGGLGRSLRRGSGACGAELRGCLCLF